MKRLQPLWDALDARPAIADCDCKDCTRQHTARALLTRLENVLAFLEEMSKAEDPMVRYSARDLRLVLEGLDAVEEP